MTLGLAIDPGKKGHGLAIFDLNNGELLHAQLTNGLGGQAHPLLETLPELEPFFASSPGAELVIERPKIYDREHQKGDQRDLIDLAIVVGAIASRAAPQVGSVLLVEPTQWKGNVPKNVTEKRARKALSTDELETVNLPSAAGLHHNVWDAVGIGLWRWEVIRASACGRSS